MTTTTTLAKIYGSTAATSHVMCATRVSHASRSLLAAVALVPLAACVTAPVATPATPFEQDVVAATEQLTNQWRAQQNLPQFLARLSPTSVVVGPFVNVVADTPAAGSQKPIFALPESIAAAKAKQIVASHLDTTAPELKRIPADVAAEKPVDLMLSASLAPKEAQVPGLPGAKPTAAQAQGDVAQVLTLVLIDSKTREVLARSQGPVRTPAADTLPTTYSADSPVIFKQAATGTNAKAGTQLSTDDMAAVGTLGLINQAQDAYGTGQYQKALTIFQTAATQASNYTIRAYNGQYLSLLKLGREKEAREAFTHVISEGFKAQTLAVKLLFTPGQTTFLADPAVSGAYGFWLQEISVQAAAAPSCMEVSGHTSRTGEEGFNQRLSLARSQRVLDLMRANQPGLAPRLSATGKGWSENIVGSGTDDALDAIDRRVEFKIAPCVMASKAGQAG
jgi:tetratricopeptide (TPR) repeat protein